MFLQIAIATTLILLTIVVGAGAFWALEWLLSVRQKWLHREPHGPKLMLVLCLSVVWTLAMMTVCVWIWALSLYALGIFTTMEASVYFSLVAFTTLGFGDILLPQEWRLLGGMAAANGLLNFGLLTAMLVEVMRNVRLGQRQSRTKSSS
ncbi:ion channel [Tranquillimonas alkanivorans]|uniref:Ion channel n=1 Tax=Tranquillimonas alkanivorans TaxID=441119 RepID=A0A1I5PJ44_9RHOB|nr:ion channel [Tranquillimonas alkanivorans]SFP34142.1 Ion channel [Tranquillimonas alkanivorans]